MFGGASKLTPGAILVTIPANTPKVTFTLLGAGGGGGAGAAGGGGGVDHWNDYAFGNTSPINAHLGWDRRCGGSRVHLLAPEAQGATSGSFVARAGQVRRLAPAWAGGGGPRAFIATSIGTLLVVAGGGGGGGGLASKSAAGGAGGAGPI